MRDEDGTNGLLRLEQMLHRVDRIVADSELACVLNSLICKDFVNFVTDEELGAELKELYKKSIKTAGEASLMRVASGYPHEVKRVECAQVLSNE